MKVVPQRRELSRQTGYSAAQAKHRCRWRRDGVEVFQKVVVGADASDTAAEAVRQAIEIVKLTGGELHIVSAYRPQHLSASGAADQSLATGDLAESVLADHASRARAAGVTAQVHARSGAAAESICDLAEEIGADLIVVGNKGMAGVRRVLGSVPNSVAHHAPCSVLIAQTT
jgi:nucleotide-binding universal stress UspA family protein